MPLAVMTTPGQKACRDMSDAAQLWQRHNRGLSIALLPENKPSDIDGFIVDAAGRVVAGVEGKVRYNVSLDSFASAFGNEWLVTADKLVRACGVARSLRIPVVGFLYLADCKTLLTLPLVNADGMIHAELTCRRTATAATINGGEANRMNAFIDMTGCRVYTDDSCHANQPSSPRLFG